MSRLEAARDYGPQGYQDWSYTQITMNCTVMDTNLHYVKNIDTGVVHRSDGEIHIGEYCWINAGTVVTKGTVLPAHTIVARNKFRQ